MSPSKRASGKYKPQGLFSEFYGIIARQELDLKQETIKGTERAFPIQLFRERLSENCARDNPER